jgi:hypothetical protein
MKKILYIIFGMFIGFTSYAQSLNVIKGKVLDANSAKMLSDVTVYIQNTDISQKTTSNGTFILENVPKGDLIIVLEKTGYETQYFPKTVNNETIDLENINMYIDVNQTIDDSIITLSDDDLSDDEAGGADNVAGILQSSKDTYQRAVAFNFGQVWFKERGYDSGYGQVSFNGMPMNKISNNRPQWSDWGGLNDVLRNQVFTNGLAASESTFGGVLGTTDFVTRASNYREGGKVSYAFTNSNYDGRAMASYSTGLLETGWALTLLGSRRFAQEGYTDGTSYNAWGGFIAVEKVLNDNHSLNFTAFYTPNRRGKNSPNTQEVYDLTSTKYNAYWGYQGDRKRNARMKEIKEPTFMLGHYWTVNDKTTVNTNIMYQLGTIGNSRLGYLGTNPDPTYYQKTPSYYLQHIGSENYEEAYYNTRKFSTNAAESHIMWDDLVNANRVAGDDATFYLYEDVNDDKTIAFNSIVNSQINDNITLNGSVLYKSIKSENYARMMDLLEASYFTDKDKYASGQTAQNDLNNPNRKVVEGNKFSYDYIINASQIDAFAQAQFKYEKVDFYLAGNLGSTSYQREGLYKNGKYQDHSFGMGEKKSFPTYGTKAGITYKISGRHLINLNGGYMTMAPSLRNAYSNSRSRDGFVSNAKAEKITSVDASYIFRTSGIKARLTGYYTTFKDVSKVSFYYVDGISGQGSITSNFLTTSIYGLNKKNFGGEFGIEAQVTPTVSITGVAALGQFTYDNNPKMDYEFSEGEHVFYEKGKDIYLKNYKQASTPQRGYSLGVSYRDPNYWWVSTNANILSHNYISISEFQRQDNFYQDDFGNDQSPVPFNGATQEKIDELLKQEKFDNIFLVNIVGGKSWKVKDKYFGVFASINNVLGEEFKTGGFEQARKANYETLSADESLEIATFGNKYWYGRSTSYYLNFYLRF